MFKLATPDAIYSWLFKQVDKVILEILSDCASDLWKIKRGANTNLFIFLKGKIKNVRDYISDILWHSLKQVKDVPSNYNCRKEGRSGFKIALTEQTDWKYIWSCICLHAFSVELEMGSNWLGS